MAFALCTISSDRYVNGTATMIHSFLRTNPWFSGDIVVFHSTKLSPLSDKGMKSILKINDKIKFKKVDDSCYDQMYKHFKARIPVKREVRALRFETFVLGGYDKVMYADSDMLFLGSVEDMFNQDYGITITRDGWGGRVFTDPIKCVKNGVSMSGGLFVVSSEAIGKCYKPSLIKYGERYNMSEYDCVMYDQSVMNKFFKNTSVVIMPNKFNVNRKWISDTKKCPVSDIRAVHFCDEKPWISIPTGYTKAVGLWNTEFKMIDTKFHDEKPALKEETKNSVVKAKEAVIVKKKPVAKPAEVSVNFDVVYNKFDFTYALMTDLTSKTQNMIKSFLERNSNWFGGDILIKGTENKDILKMYSKIKFVNELSGEYDKIMYLSSDMLVSSDLYGMFSQNHGKIEIVSGNNSIRAKKAGEIAESWFKFDNKKSSCENPILFPESYFSSKKFEVSDFEKEYLAFINSLS